MTASKKVAHLAFAVLLLSLPLFGQYVGTTSPGAFDGTSSVCKTTNCWTDFNIGLTWVSASSDGLLLAGNGNDQNKIYWWDSATNAWVEQAALETANGHQVAFIAVGAQSGYIVGVTYETGNNVYYTDMAHKSWQPITGQNCQAPNIGISMSDDLWCLDGAGTPHHYTGSGVWTSPGGTFTSISVSGNTTTFMYAINSLHQLWGWTGTTWNAAQGLGFTPSSAPKSVAGGQDGSIAVVDTAGKVHISEDGGGTWNAVYGSVLSVTAGGLNSTYAIAPSGQVLHYDGLIFAGTQATSGQMGCASNCPPGTTHTGTASSSFPHGLNKGTSTQGVNPDNPMNVAHMDYSPSCDVVFTFSNPTNPECNAALTSTVTCPVMGKLLNTSTNMIGSVIRVYTKVYYVSTTGSYYILPVTKIRLNEYLTSDLCTGGTNIHVQAIWDTIPGPYWIAQTYLYGYVSTNFDIGYWYWIWTIAGATTSPLPFNCDSAPGNPVVNHRESQQRSNHRQNLKGGSSMMQIVWKDEKHPTKTVWVNEATGELIAVLGQQCPDGYREPTLEEADRIFRNREVEQFMER